MSVEKYAVIGNPIAHSKSPLIHQAFAKQFDKNISYERILAPLDGFDSTVRKLVADEYKGVNVTLPFKKDAFNFATQLTSRANDAEASNTLTFKSDEVIVADNTDGVGLVRDIEQNLGYEISTTKVLLLGAGGAAEGVAHLLAEKMPSMFVIANRTLDKAVAMVKKLELIDGYKATSITSSEFIGLNDVQFDIVINATSAGITDTKLAIPDSIFAKGCLAYDMMYGRETPFMKQARDHGAQVADGLGMLVEQAAEAFNIWHGLMPNTASVIAQFRS